jgi:hypothetical protein
MNIRAQKEGKYTVISGNWAMKLRNVVSIVRKIPCMATALRTLCSTAKTSGLPKNLFSFIIINLDYGFSILVEAKITNLE